MTREEAQRSLVQTTIYTSAEVAAYLDDAEKLGVSMESATRIVAACGGRLIDLCIVLQQPCG